MDRHLKSQTTSLRIHPESCNISHLKPGGSFIIMDELSQHKGEGMDK